MNHKQVLQIVKETLDKCDADIKTLIEIRNLNTDKPKEWQDDVNNFIDTGINQIYEFNQVILKLNQ